MRPRSGCYPHFCWWGRSRPRPVQGVQFLQLKTHTRGPRDFVEKKNTTKKGYKLDSEGLVYFKESRGVKTGVALKKKENVTWEYDPSSDTLRNHMP